MIINPQNYFYLHGGGTLKDIDDLLIALKSMPQETFSYHVTNEKNDFSSWTKDILQDKVLAQRLSIAKTKEKMTELIEKRMAAMAKTRTKKKIIEQIKEVHRDE